MKRRTLKLVALPVIVGASVAGGFAAAVFTASGSVEADGKVATPVSPTATARIDSLWPGVCSDVSVTFTNDNAQPVVIDAISGQITKQPDTGDASVDSLGSGTGGRDHGGGTGDDHASSRLVVWQGSADALQGRQIAAGGSETFTIPKAVCLSSKAGNDVTGDDVAASIDFGFHIPVGTEYEG